uniref:Uncharacterized protein n=1 Tax=Knipowitschia caucasica TaxID=637954 RepID=A0AAV2K9V3_KNICA
MRRYSASYLHLEPRRHDSVMKYSISLRYSTRPLKKRGGGWFVFVCECGGGGAYRNQWTLRNVATRCRVEQRDACVHGDYSPLFTLCGMLQQCPASRLHGNRGTCHVPQCGAGGFTMKLRMN